MLSHRFAALVALAGCAVAAPAVAAQRVALDSDVYVERAGPNARRVLEPATTLARGDRVVYVVRWEKRDGAGGFTVTNPLPRAVHFQGSADGDEQVSIDGGRTWGRLAQLRVGDRIAVPEDVTHVRWRVDPRTAQRGRGRIAYSAIVR